jgi:hypothetical protein
MVVRNGRGKSASCDDGVGRLCTECGLCVKLDTAIVEGVGIVDVSIAIDFSVALCEIVSPG